MAKNVNIKKIEKLRKKITDIDERIKNELEQKQAYVKEIEVLEAESIIMACKSNNISLSEAVESFSLYSKIKETGLSTDDITELISSNNTLSPMDTKSETEE